MYNKRKRYYLIGECCIISILLLCMCSKRKSELVWNQDFPVIGSQSSVRVADLNEDSVLDIVMGAGKNEYQQSDQGIIALDGKTGKILWQQSAPDQVYGSATCYDVTSDGVKDVFIGGRSPHFKAINGKTGELIWEYNYHFEDDPILKYAHFNFNNSVLIPDQNNDGLSDLLTVNGGNSKADPYSNDGRYPGVLIIFDSKTGNVIAADTMPDGKESYMSPLCFVQPGAQESSIVFGTGGETIDGNLYLAKLSDLKSNKLSNAKVIASEQGHGFIAPASLADINGDGYYDIVAISHASSIFAIDGINKKMIWKQKVPNTESSNSFAVGYFTEDTIPDFFTFVSKGEWPNSTGSLQIMLDGKDGRVAYSDSIGCTGFSSPVIYDLNMDGRDEAIISVNEFDCSLGFAGKSPPDTGNRLVAIDFVGKRVNTIDEAKGFKNVFTTPWVGDLDGDGYLDIVYCQYFHRADILSFLGMRVRRISSPVKIKKPVLWGAYMSSDGDGIFPIKNHLNQ